MSKIRSALVIGGGVAGTTAALALHQAGIEVAVHEAYPDSGGGIGGSLALAPNGQAALDIVGARDAVAADSIPIEHTVMAFGKREIEMPALPDLGPLCVVERPHLHGTLRALCERAGIEVRHGSRLTGVDEDATGVTARFDDGSTARADVLIGADGVHSTVRTLIDPNAPGPGYTGLLGAEAIVDVDLPIKPATMHFTFGAKAYYLYWRTPDGRTQFGVNLPQDRPMRLTEARAIPAREWLDRLRAVYGDDEPGGRLVRALDPQQLRVTGSMHIMPSVPHWYRGRLVLAGDAVHAPSNSSGQGASLGIESGIELARCLRDLPDHTAAFAAYERLRRPRVEKIAAAAARINHVKAPGPVSRLATPVLMRLLLATAMRPERMLGPTLRYQIDWSATVPAYA